MNTPETIQIIVADDHQMVRRSLALLISAFCDLELIGEAANGQELMDLCTFLTPDIVLMDIAMPVMNGIQATKELQAVHPEIAVLGLTSSKDSSLLQQMVDAGASKCLSKDLSADELLSSIRLVYSSREKLVS